MADLLAPTTASPIDPALLNRFRSAFEAEPARIQAMNAVSAAPIATVALSRRKVSALDRSFSVHLPENPATAQKSSGRCWLFAALNTFRPKAIAAMNIDADFEFSQNYLMFWDKLEKSNFFLENILATLDEPTGSRLLDWLLQSPIQDGGQWHMFVNLIEKYGVCPKARMPETESSSSTGAMNAQVTARLRAQACELRKAAAAGASPSELRERKNEMLQGIYAMLCVHLGEPPTQFDWQWRDKERSFRSDGVLTPKEFYGRYADQDLRSKVCLIHDPRPGHAFNRTYTVRFLGNVVGGERIVYLNVDLDTMKQAAIAQMQNGQPVWFGCDVGKHLERKLGVMDLDLFDYRSVYGPFETMSKAERLMYGQSQMTHAMVFTGVDLDPSGKPKKWRVENSWGDENGDKGFYQMTDAWFDEYNYEVVVDRSYVPESALAALGQEPIELDPWDPMGSLA